MKKVLVIVITIIVAGMLSACSTKGLEAYNNAVTKTNSEKMGKTFFDITVNMDFNTDGLTLEETRELNHFKEMVYQITNQYDITKDKIATDIYMNLGGIGMDSNYYRDGDKEFIRIPVLRKYVNIKEKKEEAVNNHYETSFSDISSKWLELLGEDDVVKGEDTIIDTEEGKVKAKAVTITIKDEQLKAFSEEVIRIITETGMMDDFVFVTDGDWDKDEVVQSIYDSMERITFESFEAKAYIDFDGYLIKEDMTIGISMKDPKKGEPRSIKISYEERHWDIGKEQIMDIPEINEEDIIEMDELKGLDTIIGF